MHLALQRLAIPPNLPNQKLFKITTSAGKGQGWKALKDIQPGTPLLDEEALFWVSDDTTVDETFDRFEGFSTLSCPNPATPQRRFEVNSFAMGKDRRQKTRSGIFLLASRINHSCIPNAYCAWNSDLGKKGRLTVYAIVYIPKHAEILIDYCYPDSFKSRDQRHQGRSNYGFTCTCTACQLNTDSGMRSQNSRQIMGNLESQIDQRVPQDNNENSLHDLYRLSELLEEERLLYPQLADVYHQIALELRRKVQRVAGITGYEKTFRTEALQIARKKLDLDVKCNGHHSREVKKTLKFIRELC